MKTRTFGALALAVSILALAGCESTPLDSASTGVPVETRTPVPAGSVPSAAMPNSTPQSNVASVDLTRNSANAKNGSADAMSLSQRVVLFDFDSFQVKDEYRPMLEAHAKALAANRSKAMVIEGHTDERGGREYNLALGQKRAEAVLRSMTLLGAPERQLEAVSFGEERPVAAGSDETAWARNRRAELKDR